MSVFLSVVVPTYNRRDSLQVTLDGLARQSYPTSKFEVVVLSDGSTDTTDTFLNEYAKTAPYTLRPFRQDNAGPARARNRGVQEAHGAVIVFVDDDVEPMPEFLATHAAHHERDEKIVVIGPQLPDPKRRREEPVWIAWEHAMLERQYEAWRTGLWPGAGPNHFYTGNASVRREHILAVGGFDETFKRQEDVELAFRMENERQTHFLFDPNTRAIHRPTRTFASWLNTPYAYGRNDVLRAVRGNAPWDMVVFGYHARNRATRLLARLTLTYPALIAPVRASLLAGARSAYRLPNPTRRMAFQVLSTLYNLRYLEGARDELGSWPKLRSLIDHPDSGAELSTSERAAS